MTQDLSDFAQRATLAQQVGRKCVAKLVRAFSRPINPRFGQGVPDQRTDGTLIFETRHRCFGAEE